METPSFMSTNVAPVGSSIFAVFSIVAIFFLVLFVLRRYLPLRTTPAYITLPVFLALALPASVILLLPIDLTSSTLNPTSPSGIWLPTRVVLVSWRITYWLTFVLTWVILPFLGEYTDSGYRTVNARIRYSVRSNARYQLFVIGSAVVGLIYVVIQNGFRFASLKSLIMALAYVWGLILAIYLMGHGLVVIPRGLWRNARPGNKLRRLQTRAPLIYDRLIDAKSSLEDIKTQISELRKRKTSLSLDLQDWVEELAELASVPDSRWAPISETGGSKSNVPAVITERYMADITRSLIRARHQNARFTDTWRRLVQEAADCQAILDSSASKRLQFSRPSLHSSSFDRLSLISPYLRYHLHVHILPVVRMALAGIFAFSSACIVWSELVKSFAPRVSIISLSVTRNRSDAGAVAFIQQVIAAAWILYMCSAAFAGISDTKVWGNRALVPRNTYGESACWYAGLVARLTIPLAYNFLTLLPGDVHRETTFYRFLGRFIDLTRLGKGFDYFFPIFILVPVCATLFNMYGKVKSAFGFEMLDQDDEDGLASGWREGRELINQELSGPGFLGLSSRSAVDPRQASGSGEGRSTPSRAPTLWVPPAESSSLPRQEHSRTTQNPTAPTLAEDDEEDNFFQSFVHRVKNTLDTTAKPKWLQGGGPSFKRPRWMEGQ